MVTRHLSVLCWSTLRELSSSFLTSPSAQAVLAHRLHQLTGLYYLDAIRLFPQDDQIEPLVELSIDEVYALLGQNTAISRLAVTALPQLFTQYPDSMFTRLHALELSRPSLKDFLPSSKLAILLRLLPNVCSLDVGRCFERVELDILEDIVTYCPKLEALSISTIDWSPLHKHENIRQLLIMVRTNGSTEHPLKYVVSVKELERAVATQRSWNPPKVGVNVNVQSIFDDDFSDSLFTSMFSTPSFAKDDPTAQMAKLRDVGVDFASPNFMMHRLSQPVPSLLVAATHTGVRTTLALLEAGVDPSVMNPITGESMFLALFSQSEFVPDVYNYVFGQVFDDVLRKTGKSPEQLLTNHKLRGPLHILADSFSSSIDSLISWGMGPEMNEKLHLDVNAPDIDDRTPIFFARKKGSFQSLIRHGASLEKVDKFGRSLGQHLVESTGQSEAFASLILELEDQRRHDEIKKLISIKALVRLSLQSTLERDALRAMIVQTIPGREDDLLQAAQLALRHHRSIIMDVMLELLLAGHGPDRLGDLFHADTKLTPTSKAISQVLERLFASLDQPFDITPWKEAFPDAAQSKYLLHALAAQSNAYELFRLLELLKNKLGHSPLTSAEIRPINTQQSDQLAKYFQGLWAAGPNKAQPIKCPSRLSAILALKDDDGRTASAVVLRCRTSVRLACHTLLVFQLAGAKLPKPADWPTPAEAVAVPTFYGDTDGLLSAWIKDQTLPQHTATRWMVELANSIRQ